MLVERSGAGCHGQAERGHAERVPGAPIPAPSAWACHAPRMRVDSLGNPDPHLIFRVWIPVLSLLFLPS